MTLNIQQIIEALQAPTMEAVITLSERTQTLECNPTGTIYSFYRAIDQTVVIGYSDNLDQIAIDMSNRDFRLVASRRGTRREEKLTRMTLQENNINYTYDEHYFNANEETLKLLEQLYWPIGCLSPDNSQTIEGTPTRSRDEIAD